jgi:DNA topoisomerase IA
MGMVYSQFLRGIEDLLVGFPFSRLIERLSSNQRGLERRVHATNKSHANLEAMLKNRVQSS